MKLNWLRTIPLPTSKIVLLAALFAAPLFGRGADTVPTDVQQPGTQPREIGNLESVAKCDNCHGGYHAAVEPAHTWRGSMMAHAGRDPLFWATMAIAEQDFDGSGDLCLRCHAPAGWYAGRSTPTDGSGLAAGDGEGVECDLCHQMTNPDDSEHAGAQTPPFLANDWGDSGSDPLFVQGYYGTGMVSLWGGNVKLGPYLDTGARHPYLQSLFHRSREFCGSCHDVSNPVVGNLSHNNGAQATGDPVVADGTPGGPVDGKAAFNNLPFRYGVVERTFSEYMAGGLSDYPVSGYPALPPDLRGGALEAAYQAALGAGTGGNYEDGTLRSFTCQTCHLPPVTGEGADMSGLLMRKDLPQHDMTGGNYWVPEAIKYLDGLGRLRLGGSLLPGQIAALEDGAARARRQLNLAASLLVNGDQLKVINHTGHKLISGYPEGRRMWLHVVWFDEHGTVLREDGAYGPLFNDLGNPVEVVDPADPTGATSVQVHSLLDLGDSDTRVYEAHYGMTREWARQLYDLGYPDTFELGYDRETGAVDETLADLRGEPAGTAEETFHFVLNNVVIKDNRIPPYGMGYEAARVRNVLPVPADQFGGAPGKTYAYWDEFTLDPPEGADHAAIELKYQPTSWEYIQFLYLANDGTNAFLGATGDDMLEAWLHTGMAEPHTMATATWYAVPPVQSVTVQFAAAGATVGEAAGNALALVVATTSDGLPVAPPVSVHYATADGTATSPNDYGAEAGTLSIPAGSASGTSFPLSFTVQDDDVDEGDEQFTIRLSNAVNARVGLVDTHTVMITDDDLADIGVTPTSGLVTDESGATASFSVVLGSEPLGDVTVTLDVDDSSEGSVAPGSLLFTPLNWDAARDVAVTGVDDPEDDGDIAYKVITVAAVSTDPNYDGLNAADVDVVNQDNDTAAIDCGVEAVVLDEKIYRNVFVCDATASISAGTVTVTGTAEVTFTAPVTRLGPSFNVEQGGVFRVVLP